MTPRRDLSLHLAQAVCAAATVFVAMLGWGGLTADSSRFLVPLFAGCALISISGAVARWQRVPLTLVWLAQTLIAGALVLREATGSLVPSPRTAGVLVEALRGAAESAARYAAPVPADVPSVHLLLLIAGLASVLLVDLVAVATHRVASSGLVLLTLYSVPIGLLPEGPSWFDFALLAAGFALLLFLRQVELVSSWGADQRVADSDRDDSVRTGAWKSAALALTTIAIAGGILAAWITPTLDAAGFGGMGSGGSRNIVVKNPIVDLRRDLTRGADVPLLQVRADRNRRPEYLRIAVLTRYNGSSWIAGNRQIPDGNRADGPVAPPRSIDPTHRRIAQHWQLTAEPEFESTWLPTMPLSTAVLAPGDWRYDTSTMDFLAADEDLTTAGLSWQLDGVELDYDLAEVDRRSDGAADVDAQFTALLPTMPTDVRALAEEVTGGAATKFRKARALQDWFRSEFTYDLSRAESMGSSIGDLSQFLSPEGRRGYCEQFAAAMALMARTLDIPARVSVGFLRPDATPGDARLWQFSAWDLHAWPELYFPGAGWVRFEPTPGARTARAPGYTTRAIGAPAVTPTPSAGATAAAPADPRPTKKADPGRTNTDDTEQDGARAWIWIVALVALGLTLLLALPMMVRQRRRQRRLTGSIEDCWGEIADTAIDLGLGWPASASPRQQGQWLTSHGDAAHPIDRLVLALEVSRYARPGSYAPVTTLAEDAESVIGALESRASRRQARLARWWSRSVVRLATRTADREPTASESAGVAASAPALFHAVEK